MASCSPCTCPLEPRALEQAHDSGSVDSLPARPRKLSGKAPPSRLLPWEIACRTAARRNREPAVSPPTGCPADYQPSSLSTLSHLLIRRSGTQKSSRHRLLH